jgi:hypothetical protein
MFVTLANREIGFLKCRVRPLPRVGSDYKAMRF